ncbi:MAG: Ig-like domain-containing protein, partial [Chloroflexota bacterium]
MFNYTSGKSESRQWRAAMQHLSHILLPLLLVFQLVLGCRPPATPTVPTPVGGGEGGLTVVRSGVSTSGEGGEDGMKLVLSEGSELAVELAQVPVALTLPLSPDETQAVLDRLSELEGEAADVKEFRFPAETLPAPRPGETIEQPFPPEEAVEPGEEPVAGPLKVLRYSPQGDVPLAPYLSVTFDQPMVALTAHADLAAKGVPVKLSPQPEGEWRWVGTKTLMFEPVTRFPMATDYSVTIPANTRSATGGALAETVAWTFSTPPPQMQSSYPNQGPHVRDPLFFVAFDQRINPAAVLETIAVKAGRQVFPVVLAEAEEAEADETVSRMAKSAGEGRWLAFRVTEELPYDTTVTVDIGPGTPSEEGPRTTESVQSFSFTTYGPLKVVETRCGWGDECRPMMPWTIRFSNPLDEEAFDESMVVIKPELPGGKLSIFGETLRIEGRSQGRTTYKV